MGTETKPEDIVEVLPSSSSTPDKKPAGRTSSWILVSVGLIVLGGAGVFLKLHPSAPVTQTPTAKPLAQMTVNSPVAISKASSSPTSPSTPSAAEATAPLVLNVQGVMASGGHNVALINNNIYEEGSLVNGAKILKIDLNAITIEHDGKQEIVTVTK